MKTGNISSAPLYVVYGSLTSNNSLSIRPYPLKKAKNRDGLWYYPSDLGMKKVAETELGSIDHEVNRAGKVIYRVFFNKKTLLENMVELMSKQLTKSSTGKIKMPAAVKPVTKPKPVVKEVKSNKINKTNVTMPEDAKMLTGRDLEDYMAVQNILNGHSNEFSVIYKRYYDVILFRYCRSFNFTQNELAKDLLMEMFTKVFEKLNQYTPKFTFNAWITKIAKNYLIDYCRKVRNVHMVSIDKAFGDDEGQEMTMANILPDDGSNCPEKMYEDVQRKEALQKALSHLDAQVRRMVIMRFFYKASYAEIMKEENVSESHVKISIFRAKQKLKEVLTSNPQLLAACAV
jgi:RNA polymerase sigma-70 factor (ECF subfamily)